jgi:hypothetical protein
MANAPVGSTCENQINAMSAIPYFNSTGLCDPDQPAPSTSATVRSGDIDLGQTRGASLDGCKMVPDLPTLIVVDDFY